ncbi:MAG: PadR family transcriptional regulator [Clostridia bacterium]|nr:PadR family transcriptional regulator [Clostridia bacterium]
MDYGNAVAEINKQLKKGIIEILILKLLSSQSMYGYQLMQELDTKSRGVFKMKEGTLYPILYRLEDNSLIESCWEQDSSDRRSVPRKYYRITKEGRSELVNMEKELKALLDVVKSIMQWEV